MQSDNKIEYMFINMLNLFIFSGWGGGGVGVVTGIEAGIHHGLVTTPVHHKVHTIHSHTPGAIL